MSDKPVSAAGDGVFLGLLRQLASELRHVRDRVDALRTALAKVSEAPKSSRRQDAIEAKETLVHALEVNRPEVEVLLARLTKELEKPDTRDYWGDQVTQIENLCEEAFYLLDPVGQSTTLPAAADMLTARSRLDAAVLISCYTTVPPRLNQYLKNYRNGQVLRFDDTFREELSTEHIGKVIEYLYNQPRCVNGIVDVQSRTVTKVSGEVWRRVATFVVLALLVIVFLVGPPLLRDVDGAQSWFEKQPKDSKLVGGIILTFLGGLAHVVIGAVKQVKTSIADDDSRRFVSLDNWVVWAAAHEADLLTAVVILGVLGTYFAGTLGTTDAVKLFTVGYSADSVVEVLRPKFEKAMARRTEVVGG